MPDFDQIEKDVVTRIRLIKAVYEHMKPEELTLVHSTLIIPCMKLLAEFCACVKISEDEG
jgi:cytochrome c oxidase subunit IV